ncbi:MAG: methionyl-tRNA formyltransferase, partial [Bacteroidetes bacterium]|nr:methionyl-tRNA formyltransferase [Bacteroidota bacterium]
FNLHASLLPKYRGAAPINWAIINGETETGVTTFFLQDKVDTGSMLLQRSIPIGPDDVAGDVHDRLAMLGADVVLETVRAIESGKAVPQAQDDTLVSRAPKIFREDCRIDWTMTAKQVHDRVRGLSPSPCGWTMHGERVLKIYRANILEGIPTQPAGTITQVTPTALHVATGNGVVALVDVQQEGKRRMPIDEFLRGYRIAVGERLG